MPSVCPNQSVFGQEFAQRQTGPVAQIAFLNILVEEPVLGIIVEFVDHEVAAGLGEVLVLDDPNVGVAQIVEAVQHEKIRVVGVSVDALGVGRAIVVHLTEIEYEVHVLELIEETVVTVVVGHFDVEANIGMYRSYLTGVLTNINYRDEYPYTPKPWVGYYWTAGIGSTAALSTAMFFDLNTSRATVNGYKAVTDQKRGNAMQIRCVKDE